MDIMAIDGAQVPDMKNAIETYTTRVEEDLNNIKAYEINSADGVYGAEQITTINTYIASTCAEINQIVRYFDQFKDALQQVSEEYESQQARITTGDVAAHKAASDDMINVNRMS